MVLLVALHSAW
jgi:hypothetical protein